jgi:Secretion system C-terminal sorting domain
MLKRTLFSFLLFSSLMVANAQTKTTNYYQKVFFNDSIPMSFRAVVANNDGTHVILGDYQNSTNRGDMVLMKTDTLGNILWSSVIGNDSTEEAQALARTPDGGYVFAGDITDPRDFNKVKMEVGKVDANGNLLWSSIFGGKDGNQANGISVLGNGKIIVSGKGIREGDAFDSGYTLTLDQNGTPDDGKFYKKGSFNAFLSSAQQTTDGGVALGGSNWTSFASPTFYDPMLIKVNSKGDTIWSKVYNIPNTQFAYLMRVTPSSDFIMGGQVAVSDSYRGTFLMKADKDGNFKWLKGYNAFPNEDKYFQRIYDIAPIRDGYVATGIVRDGTTDSIKVKSFYSGLDTIIIGNREKGFLMKTDTAGNVLWSRVYADTVIPSYLSSRSTQLFNVVPTFDGGFTIVGSTINYGAKLGGGILIHVDKDGYMTGGQNSCNVTNPLTWSVRNFTGVDSTGMNITESGDESPLKVRKVAGIFKKADICIAKGTYIPTSLRDELLPESAVKIYPNPTRDELFIELLTGNKAQSKVTIFDLTGRIIHTEKTNFDILRIDTPQYSRGIYFVRVEQEGRFLTKKIIVQ